MSGKYRSETRNGTHNWQLQSRICWHVVLKIKNLLSNINEAQCEKP